MITIIGNYMSPFVRKVLVSLETKGVPYRIDPIVPFFGDDDFAKLSPLRRIPVLIEGDLTLCDSTVICEYLEERFPAPALLPASPADRARARWIEEYADSRMADVFVWRVFAQLVLRRGVWDEQPDRELVARTLAEDVPQVFDYLETIVPDEGWLVGDAASIADIAIGSMLRNFMIARQSIDAERWPRTAGLVARVHALPAFEALWRWEQVIAQTRGLAAQRAALAEAGAPLTETSFAADAPRRGIMPLGESAVSG